MVLTQAMYEGDLRCSVKHGPTGTTIRTDAPKDNQGRGEMFSPTDLLGAALGSCMLTIMGIYARNHNLDLAGATVDVAKDMTSTPPRRVGRFTITVKIPKPVPQEQRKALENAGLTCPVEKSLHPDIERVVKFVYGQ